jgi:hypothetical protein
MFIGILISFAVCIAINFAVIILLSLAGVQNAAIISIVSCLSISLFFAIYSFRKDPRGRLRNPDFHKYFATNFVIILLITYLFNYL